MTDEKLAEWQIQKDIEKLDKKEGITGYRYNQAEKIELLDRYEVYEKNKDGKNTGSLNCSRLAKLLLESDDRYYLVTNDNQEIFSFNGSYYESNGDALIRERVQYYLDDLKGLEHIKNEVVGYIKNHAYVDRELLNPPLNLINLKNGIYNIETNELIPHDPEHYFLQEIPIKYNKDSQIKEIKNFLEQMLNLDDITIIQEFFGDCLLRSYPHKKALMMVGLTDTGKSQLLSLLGKFLGEKNTSDVSLYDLCHDRFATIELYGKSANICADIGANTLAKTEIFLMVTGGDRLGGQRKFQQRFNFRNYAKLVFSCNKIPESENKNDAYYNRWLVIECSNQIPKEEQIPNFFEKLATEEELSGLFNWAIEGIKRLQENKGYSKHRDLEEVKAFMEKGSNPILEFTTTYVEKDTSGEITKTHLYDCYLEFCKQMNYPAKDSNVFSRKFKPLAPMGIDEGQTQKGGHSKVWRGIKCTWILSTDKEQEKLEC